MSDTPGPHIRPIALRSRRVLATVAMVHTLAALARELADQAAAARTL
jgi:hypothetical protein